MEKADEKADEKELLCFNGKGLAYAVEFSEVMVICARVPVERIPCLPKYFMGICHYKGVMIPVVTMEEEAGSNKGEVIILVNTDEYIFGICVSGDPWICTVEDHQIAEIYESLVAGIWREKAVYRTDKEIICLLDLEQSARELAN